MNKRIVAAVLLLVVLISCFSFAANAETKRGVLHKHDKWVMSVNLLTLNFKSTYNDCTALNCISTSDSIGLRTHRTKVTNHQTGATTGWVYAVHTKNAVAQIKGNWEGDATAYIGYDPTGRWK